MSNTIRFCNAFKSWLGGKVHITHGSYRSISSCNSQFNKYESREARFIRKIMGHKNGGRKPWFKSEGIVPGSSFPKTESSKGGQNQKRIAVLNKLFMRHISDMMSTGAVSKEIVGRGLEISRVKTAPDFNRINVFWLAKGTEDDAEVQKILENYSRLLRHELSQLRVIGIVPPVYFIKDKAYAKTVEVNRILATADFGEDYIPVDAGYRLKAEFAQTFQLPPEIMDKIEELEEQEQLNKDLAIPLPPMRTDVLGLKHTEIMAKIKKGMKKTKASHRQISSHSTTIEDSSNAVELIVNTNLDSEDIEPTLNNINLKKEEFRKFLMKQKLQQKKIMRGKKNYTPEMELHEMEILENSKVAAEFMENVDKEKDFIDEVEDSYRT